MISLEKACEQCGWSTTYRTTADQKYQLIVYVPSNDYISVVISVVTDLIWRYYPQAIYKEIRWAHSSPSLIFDLGTVFDLITNVTKFDKVQ